MSWSSGSERGAVPWPRSTHEAPTGPRVEPALRPGFLANAYALLVQNLSDHALLLLDDTGHVMTWNRGAEAIKGYRAEQIVGRHISTFYTPEAVAVGHPARELEIAALTGEYAEDGWRVRRDGSRFWARVKITALHDDAGTLVGFGKLTTDLTEERQRQEQAANVLAVLEQTARLDHLTGLPNRRALDERLAAETTRARRNGRALSVALIDLDHFKRFNDERGHQAGDKLLKLAALRWRQALRPGDVIARYGGEEFVLVLPDCDLETAPGVVQRLIEATPEKQTCSAGVATWDPEESVEDVISRADRALYVAKDAGRDRVARLPA